MERLIDGEVFTVGDVCYGSENKDYYLKIRAIDIFNGDVRFFNNGVWFRSLNDIQHVEKLFTTEDGVDVYLGENYYAINTKCIKGQEGFEKIYPCSTLDDGVSHRYPHMKCFKSSKRAEEYILLNKVCLSAKDIIKEGQTFKENPNLLKIVKSKIDLVN